MNNDAEAVAAAIRDICATPVGDDGLSFDAATIRVDPITEDAQYEGLRVEFHGKLGNAKIRMQIDIGFGDRVTPALEVIEYPSVLGMETSRLRAYPPETSIAEKFQIMLHRGTLNSRMKDFFDVWALATSRRFDGAVLADAVRATCSRRDTVVPARPDAFRNESLTDGSRQTQWIAFRRRIRDTDAPDRFADVMILVSGLLEPVADAIAHGSSFTRTWAPGGPWR